jgi:hypothetical protein
MAFGRETGLNGAIMIPLLDHMGPAHQALKSPGNVSD